MNIRYWIKYLGGADKIRKLGVPVRTLVSFDGH